MKNKDLLQKFLFSNQAIRGELVHLDKSFKTIMEQHRYPATIRDLLGQVLASACLLNGIIKMEGRLTIQFQGKGQLKLLLAQCSHEFQLRGIAQWDGEISQIELFDNMEKGLLVISIDPEKNLNRYQGIVEWRGNSLAQSIEHYFKNSEQLATRLWLAVDEHRAAGLLLQMMPEAADKSSDWEHIIHLTETITREELLNLDDKVLLHRLYSQEQVRIFEPNHIEFQCSCSYARSENAITLMGKEDIEQELKEKQKIVVICEFCNREYVFDRNDIARIFRVH